MSSDDIIPSKHKRRNIGLVLGSMIVTFTVLMLYFFPVFNDRTGFEIVQEWLDGFDTEDIQATGDEPPGGDGEA